MSDWHLRLWRRLRVAPGVRLNLSRGGLSVTIGGRVLKVTFGPAGTTETLSAPGTGFRLTKHEPPE